VFTSGSEAVAWSFFVGFTGTPIEKADANTRPALRHLRPLPRLELSEAERPRVPWSWEGEA
jgi:hypothetical protein